MTCYPSDTALCWVCGKDECPWPEREKPKQLALFEVDNPHKCGKCAHLLNGVCAIKSHEQGAEIRKAATDTACYAFVNSGT